MNVDAGRAALCGLFLLVPRLKQVLARMLKWQACHAQARHYSEHEEHKACSFYHIVHSPCFSFMYVPVYTPTVNY